MSIKLFAKSIPLPKKDKRDAKRSMIKHLNKLFKRVRKSVLKSNKMRKRFQKRLYKCKKKHTLKRCRSKNRKFLKRNLRQKVMRKMTKFWNKEIESEKEMFMSTSETPSDYGHHSNLESYSEPKDIYHSYKYGMGQGKNYHNWNTYPRYNYNSYKNYPNRNYHYTDHYDKSRYNAYNHYDNSRYNAYKNYNNSRYNAYNHYDNSGYNAYKNYDNSRYNAYNHYDNSRYHNDHDDNQHYENTPTSNIANFDAYYHSENKNSHLKDIVTTNSSPKKLSEVLDLSTLKKNHYSMTPEIKEGLKTIPEKMLYSFPSTEIFYSIERPVKTKEDHLHELDNIHNLGSKHYSESSELKDINAHTPMHNPFPMPQSWVSKMEYYH